MIKDEHIQRINELSKKSKCEGLSDCEAEEQKELRALYIEAFKRNTLNQLRNIKVVDKKGNDITPEKIRQLKNNQ